MVKFQKDSFFIAHSRSLVAIYFIKCIDFKQSAGLPKYQNCFFKQFVPTV